MKFILASASPRRKEILENVGFCFDVIPSENEEKIKGDLSPKDTVEALAYQKALDVYSSYPDSVVLGADTIVVFNGEILGKPKDKADAKRMLKMLSGQTHEVRTGYAVLGGNTEIVLSECTLVTFFALSDEEIENYANTGEPMDKAGAYGIQGKGGLLVRSILGDYFNVVGLPVANVSRCLKMVGIEPENK